MFIKDGSPWRRDTILCIAFLGHRRRACSSSLREATFNKYYALKNVFMIPNFSDKKIILGVKVKSPDPTLPLSSWMNMGNILRLTEPVCSSIIRA